MFPNAEFCAKGLAAPLLTLPLTSSPSDALLASSGDALSTLLPDPLAAALGLAPLVAPGEALTSARWKALDVLAAGGGVFLGSPFLEGGLAAEGGGDATVAVAVGALADGAAVCELGALGAGVGAEALITS